MHELKDLCLFYCCLSYSDKYYIICYISYYSGYLLFHKYKNRAGWNADSVTVEIIVLTLFPATVF